MALQVIGPGITRETLGGPISWGVFHASDHVATAHPSVFVEQAEPFGHVFGTALTTEFRLTPLAVRDGRGRQGDPMVNRRRYPPRRADATLPYSVSRHCRGERAR